MEPFLCAQCMERLWDVDLQASVVDWALGVAQGFFDDGWTVECDYRVVEAANLLVLSVVGDLTLAGTIEDDGRLATAAVL